MSTETTLTLTAVRELRDGCAGVTPGPWFASIVQNGIAEPKRKALITAEGRDGPIIATLKQAADGGTRYEANADHFHRCSPEFIQALTEGYLAMAAALERLSSQPLSGEMAGSLTDRQFRSAYDFIITKARGAARVPALKGQPS